MKYTEVDGLWYEVGDIPDDVNTADVHRELKALLGDNLEPIIVMKTWETN